MVIEEEGGVRVDRGRFGALLENLWKWVCGAFESLISSKVLYGVYATTTPQEASIQLIAEDDVFQIKGVCESKMKCRA